MLFSPFFLSSLHHLYTPIFLWAHLPALQQHRGQSRVHHCQWDHWWATGSRSLALSFSKVSSGVTLIHPVTPLRPFKFPARGICTQSHIMRWPCGSTVPQSRWQAHLWACLGTGDQEILVHVMMKGGHRIPAVLHWGCLRCTDQDTDLSEGVHTCILFQEFSWLTSMKKKSKKFSCHRVSKTTQMPQNIWEAGSHTLQLLAQRLEYVTAIQDTWHLVFLCLPSRKILSSSWCSQPVLWASKPSPGWPQLPSHLTEIYLFPLFPSAPLCPLSPPCKHWCLTLTLSLCHSECRCSFWHSQINILKILLWLKCIYSQRLLFLLSWLWGFASGTIYIDRGVPLSP